MNKLFYRQVGMEFLRSIGLDGIESRPVFYHHHYCPTVTVVLMSVLWGSWGLWGKGGLLCLEQSNPDDRWMDERARGDEYDTVTPPYNVTEKNKI